MSTFTERLQTLLPDLYLLEDAIGDLHTFLQIIGLTLDDLQAAIHDLPALVSVDVCSPEFLPYLAALVGIPGGGGR